MASYKNAVIGGKLNLKGGKKKNKKKRRAVDGPPLDETSFVELPAAPAAAPGDDALTDAERRHKKRQLDKHKDDIKNGIEKSHRERVDEFNDKLSNLTEHNDIPRISAAGNG